MAKRKGSNTKTKGTKKVKIETPKDASASDLTSNTCIENSESKEEMEDVKNKTRTFKSEEDTDWVNQSDCLIYNPVNLQSSDKIAAFDLDDTLIVPKSGNKFAQSWNDWKFLFNEVPEKLKSLHNDNYKVVVFSNQGGVEKGKVKKQDIKKKMESIVNALGFPIQVFLSIKYASVCRKPNRGMFDLLKDKYNSGVEIKLEESFYVGDAAGRPADWAPKRKKDFSCSDRLLALNCNLKFYTPEEYFLKEKEAIYNMPSFKPAEAIENYQKTFFKYDDFNKETQEIHELLPTDSETTIIIMVGTPGSGKSTFCKKYLEPLGFNVVNRDTLKTWQKCVAETKRLLSEKKSVVIDNTNPDKATRERYVTSALECQVNNIICCIMDVAENHCKHNELFRQLTVDSHDKISDMVFNMHKSKYQEPSKDEKFTLICKVNPALEFENSDQKILYSRYLLEK